MTAPHGSVSPHGSVWCETHGRYECIHNSKRSGQRCHAPAIRGRNSCVTHIGEKTEIAKAKGEANILAWNAQAAAAADLPPLDPGRVVLDQLRIAVMRADLLGERLRRLVEAEGDTGLVGATWAAGRDGTGIQSGEQIRGLAKLEAEWRDRVVRFAKTAHDMGIAERHIQLEAGKAQIVVQAFLGSLAVLSLEQAAHDRALSAFLAGIERESAVVEL